MRYDEANRVYELAHSGSATVVRFVRDLAGRVMEMTDPNGSVTKYEYDALARLVKLHEPNWPASAPVNPGKQVGVSYDPQSKRLRVTDTEAPGDFVYRYDPIGNLIERDDPDTSKLLYEYDARNALVRLHDGIGAIDFRFTLDGDARLLSMTDSAYLDQSRTFTYHRSAGVLVNNLYQIDYGASGLSTRFDYDPNRELTLAEHLLSGAALASYGYQYRRDGLLGRETGTRSAAYNYDDRKQLISEGPNTRDGYDAAGNRLWRAPAPPPQASQATFDARDRILSDEQGTVFDFDANGNMTRRAPAGDGMPTAYTYDGANRLRTVDDGPTTIRYSYDVNGRLSERVSQDGTTTQRRRYRYANTSVLAELDASGDIEVLYTRDDEGRLLRRRTKTALHPAPSHDRHSLFCLSDGLGNLVRIVDWDGRAHLSRDYDAWGKSTGQGSIGTFRYRGGYEDAHTRLIRFGARWYDPGIGRWLSQDPLLAVLAFTNTDLIPYNSEFSNLYCYVLNNPLTRWDPTGLNAQLPKGWPPPPGWKDGFKWKNAGKDKLLDPDGDSWHWHPEDKKHYEHWDEETKRGKRRLSKDGERDLGEDAFKPKEEGEKKEGDKTEESGGGETAKRVAQGAAATGAGIGIGVITWEIFKWGAAIIAAPETGGGSLAGAAALP